MLSATPKYTPDAMSTLLSILDVVVLLLLIVHVVRVVGNFSSPVLSVFVGLAVAILAIISSGVYIGLVREFSGATQAVFLVVLLLMAYILLSSWNSAEKPG